VPNNVPTGCAVPLLIQINSQISNATVMPVASGSRSCPPTSAAMASLGVEQFEEMVNAGPVTVGTIKLTRDPNPPGQPGYSDNAQFQFIKAVSYPAGSQPFLASYLDDQALGTCMVYNSLSPKSNYGASFGTAPVDAGSTFTVTGPNGSKVLTGNPGQFSATLSAAGTFLSPGAYTVSGAGGADVGAFSAAFNIPAVPALTSPANFTIPPVTRSSGMTVTWTGGASNAYVQIEVQAPTDSTNTNGATLVCNAPSSAGTFTIPSYALLALPAGSVGNYFQFQQQTESGFTAAEGLPYGLIRTSNAPTGIVSFTLN